MALMCLPTGVQAAGQAGEAGGASTLVDRLTTGLVDALGGSTAARAVTVPRAAASEAVQTRLELTDAQKKAVEDIVNPSPELLEARLKSALGDKFPGLQRVTAGLQLTQAGPAAVIHEPTATVLNLSTDQRKRIQAVVNEYNVALAELLPFGAGRTGGAGGLRGINLGDLQTKRLALQEASNKVVGEMLTPSQKEQIKKLMEEAAGIRLPTTGLDAAATAIGPAGAIGRGQ